MKYFVKSLLCAALVATSFASAPAFAAGADDYPNHPVNLIVPFAAGGGTDIFSRVVADALGKSTGQRILVENQPGAAGTIGTKAAIAAEPDGYTLVMGVGSTIAINPHNLPAADYNPLTDLKAVAVVGYTPWMLVASAKLPFDNVPDMIAYGKENPGKLTFASWTATGEMGRKIFAARSGVDLLPVPYDGAVAAMNDLVAGRASLAMIDFSSAKPFIESGDVKPLALSGKDRSNLMPDIPAISEAGIENMDVNSWDVLFVPAGTPDDIVNKLNGLVNDMLKDPEMQKKLADLGADVYIYTPQETADFVKAQYESWGKIIEETSKSD
jgi:tripartite-type tricarboxylate transporter receptor subunit TctC